MDIQGIQNLSSYNQSSDTGVQKPAPNTEKQTTDTKGKDGSILLSSQAQLVQKLIQSIPDQPDVDLNKVAAMKAKLMSGNYQIDHSTAAQKLMDSISGT